MDVQNQENSSASANQTDKVTNKMKQVKLDNEDSKKRNDSWMHQMRLDPESYKELLTLTTPELEKLNCPISPEERLQMALQFLATGEGCENLETEEMITKTCLTFVEVLGEDHLKVPRTENKWRAIAETYKKWDLAQCMSTINVCHINVTPPRGLEHKYYNDEGVPTMLLITGVDGNFKFTWVEFGFSGRTSAQDFFLETNFYNDWCEGKLNVPQGFTFVGGPEFFPEPGLIVPDSKLEKIYRERMERVLIPHKVAIELLKERFGLYKKPLALRNPHNVIYIVLVTTLLHNFLMAKNPKYAEEVKDKHVK